MHAIGPRLPGVFSDLPAIFARDVTQDGLQVEQGVLEHFGASEEGRQAALPLTQDERPGSDLLGRWSLLRVCAMIRRLHAFLVSDGWLEQRGEMRVACHIRHERKTALGWPLKPLRVCGLPLDVVLFPAHCLFAFSSATLEEK